MEVFPVFPVAWYADRDGDRVMRSIASALLGVVEGTRSVVTVSHDDEHGQTRHTELVSEGDIAHLSGIERLDVDPPVGRLDTFCFLEQWPHGSMVEWSVAVPGHDFDEDFEGFGYVTGRVGIPAVAVLVPPVWVLVEGGAGKLTPGDHLLDSMKSVWSGEAWLPHQLIETLEPYRGQRFGEEDRHETETGVWFHWASWNWDERRRVAEWLAPQLNKFWRSVRGS